MSDHDEDCPCEECRTSRATIERLERAGFPETLEKLNHIYKQLIVSQDADGFEMAAHFVSQQTRRALEAYNSQARKAHLN
jgi:hypothetical protein